MTVDGWRSGRPTLSDAEGSWALGWKPVPQPGLPGSWCCFVPGWLYLTSEFWSFKGFSLKRKTFEYLLATVCHQQGRGVAQLCDLLWFCSVSLWGAISAFTCGCFAVRGSWPFLTRARAYCWLSGIRSFSEFCWIFYHLKCVCGESVEGVFCNFTRQLVQLRERLNILMVMEPLCLSAVFSKRRLILLPMVSPRLWSDLGCLPVDHSLSLRDLEDVHLSDFCAAPVQERIGNIDVSVPDSVLHPTLMAANRNSTGGRN